MRQPSRLHIRPLLPGDMPQVMRVQALCYTSIVPESLESMRAKVRAAPAHCFLAEAEGGVVGYIITVPVKFPRLPALDAPAFDAAADADTLYLHDLAVADAGRGTGAGRALVQSAMTAARERGLRKACLVAIQDSVPYWARFGFMATHAEAALAAKLATYGATAQLMSRPLE